MSAVDLAVDAIHRLIAGVPIGPGEPSQFIMPHEALAFVMGMHARLGACSWIGMLSVDLLRTILRDMQRQVLTVMLRPHRACVEAAWTNPAPCASHSSAPRLLRPQYLPSQHWLGRVLGLNTKSSSKSAVAMKQAWRVFFHRELRGVFSFYTVVFPHYTRTWEHQTLVFESEASDSCYGHDHALVLGLLQGFFAAYAGGRTHHDVFRTRHVGKHLQIFIFGPLAPREVIWNSLVFKTPRETRTLLQPYSLYGIGWSRIAHWNGTRKRILYSDFASHEHDEKVLDCFFE